MFFPSVEGSIRTLHSSNLCLIVFTQLCLLGWRLCSSSTTASSVPCMRIWESNRSIQDCSSLSLARLPSLYPNTVSLILSHNQLHNISDFPPQYAHLKELAISSASLGLVSKEALSKLIFVNRLDLSHNQLHTLILPPLKNMKILNLSHNHLSVLPDFSLLSSLTELDLSHNDLITVPPRLLPPNIITLSLSNNNINHLTAWPFLPSLQQLDVASNPFSCHCSLFSFIQWAESKSLIDSSQLPCVNSSIFRQSPEHGKIVCGPTITAKTPTQNIVSLSQPLRLCCLISASPTPVLNWHLNGNNISRGISRQSPDIGTIEYCLQLSRIIINDLGKYSCVASLAGIVVAQEFLVERDKIPLVLDSTENMVFYAQFSITIFLVVCCCASCCLMRSQNNFKKKEERSRSVVSAYTPHHSKQFSQFPQLDEDDIEICCPHFPPCDYCELSRFGTAPTTARLSLHCASPAPSTSARTRASSFVGSSPTDMTTNNSSRHRNSVNMVTSIVKRYSQLGTGLEAEDFLEKAPSPVTFCRCHDSAALAVLAQQTDL